jgi:hypothetical protein
MLEIIVRVNPYYYKDNGKGKPLFDYLGHNNKGKPLLKNERSFAAPVQNLGKSKNLRQCKTSTSPKIWWSPAPTLYSAKP